MSLYVEGSETVSTTEWSLSTDSAGPDADTTPGWFQLLLDVNALASTDVYRLRIYEKVLSSSTQKVIYDAYLTGVQASPIYETRPLMLMHGWDMTLVKVSGTDRAIEWSIRKLSVIEQAFSGSETVSTTEHSMTTDTSGPDAETSDGVFQIFIDGPAVAAADQFRVRVYEKANSAGTQRVVFEKILSQAPTGPLVLPSIELLNGWDGTIDKLTGTDRAFDWSIRKLSAAAAAAETTYPVIG